MFDTTDPGTICDRLNRVRGVWVTSGEGGCRYAIAGYQDSVPAFEVPVVDTTGAGDAFTAGILHQLCQLRTREIDAEIAREIARYASALGALTVMKPGAIAAQPTASTVAEFLKNSIFSR